MFSELLEQRFSLINQRNQITKKLFFVFRRSLHRQIMIINKQIEEIDNKILKIREKYQSFINQLELEK